MDIGKGVDDALRKFVGSKEFFAGTSDSLDGDLFHFELVDPLAMLVDELDDIL